MVNEGFGNYKILAKEIMDEIQVKNCPRCGHPTGIKYPCYRSDGTAFVKCPICGETIHIEKWNPTQLK